MFETPALVDSILVAAGELAGDNLCATNGPPGTGGRPRVFFRKEYVWVRPPECDGGDQA